MRARSLVAAILIAFTSHLWFRQAVTACPSLSRGEHNAAQLANHETAHHDSGHRGSQRAPDAAANFQCCLAALSCGPVVALVAATPHAMVESVHLTRPLGTGVLPVSRVSAPDPPPPKA